MSVWGKIWGKKASFCMVKGSLEVLNNYRRGREFILVASTTEPLEKEREKECVCVCVCLCTNSLCSLISTRSQESKLDMKLSNRCETESTTCATLWPLI